MLDTNQRKLVEQLCKQYGEDITLRQLLDIKVDIPIEDVEFTIKYVITDGTELAGEVVELNGTIKNILKDNLLSWTVFEHNKENRKFQSLCSDEYLERLVKFFAYGKTDYYKKVNNLCTSREVTFEEIKEYIYNLDVRVKEYDCEYEDYIESFISSNN